SRLILLLLLKLIDGFLGCPLERQRRFRRPWRAPSWIISLESQRGGSAALTPVAGNLRCVCVHLAVKLCADRVQFQANRRFVEKDGGHGNVFCVLIKTVHRRG